MPSPRTVTALGGDTVDLLVHRHYGRTAGITEVVLAANPGLAGKGLVLPAGTPVSLPPVEEKAGHRQPALVRLWD